MKKHPFLTLSLLMAGLFGGLVMCTASTPFRISEKSMVEYTAPNVPAFLPPPALADETWTIPDYGRYEPPFPYLPDEDETVSRSIGDVTGGYMVNSKALPLPHRNMAILPRQFQRHLLYTGDPMIALLEDALAHVAEVYPDAVLKLGNFGRHGGGNIPHSVSHNNGRDADIAFFVLDEHGEPAHKPDLLRFGADGWFRGPDLEETRFPETVLQFDVPRNWRFVEGMILSEAADIQYVFVSNPLRRMLLAEGRRQGASARTLRIANAILVQPGGALPHDDHFHLRIHCTPTDLASGCVERGRPGPTFHNDYSERTATIARARALLEHENPYWRRTALNRLAILEISLSLGEAAALLSDPDPGVRIAAVRTLETGAAGTDALTARLASEENPFVFSEIVAELSRRGDRAADALIAALSRELAIDLGGAGELSSTALVADAIARLERPDPVPSLIEALAEAAPGSRIQIAHALRVLTNHRFTEDHLLRDDEHFASALAAWQSWWTEHQDLSRDQWVVLGFQQAGFAVEAINSRAVWELCRAISDEPYLNFNAQRMLMRLSGRQTDSLGWHPHDASFYWRRYFENNQARLGLPPVPADLTTSAGYTPPPD